MPRVHVEITHPDRLLFPADAITKLDLVGGACVVLISVAQGMSRTSR